MSTRTTMDGNTAVAHVAYRTNEVCAIFPITPSSPMADLADQWMSEGLKNIWGNVPAVQEMQAEGGAAGATHGALQSGAVTTTFTASQGLMLMLPNMFKIAGELTSTVFHVASRSLATSALSIFGDHADVMTTRPTGFALFCSGSVQEAHDSALIAQMATLEARVPFVHFFDGFRTSHELNTLDLLSDAEIRSMIDDGLVRAHRARGLSPENPFIRGTAQNPDIFFQAREAVNIYYDRVPGIVEAAMQRFGSMTGRNYEIFDYTGDADADRVMILMGSGAETARATAAALREKGEKVGVLQVRLYRPFSTAHLLAALPASVRGVVVLDRTKEPGGIGEPLFLDIITALAGAVANGDRASMPRVIGGRYGLSSKDFTPAMAKAAFDELTRDKPRNGFTVGINDDVTHTSLAIDPAFNVDKPEVNRKNRPPALHNEIVDIHAKACARRRADDDHIGTTSLLRDEICRTIECDARAPINAPNTLLDQKPELRLGLLHVVLCFALSYVDQFPRNVTVAVEALHQLASSDTDHSGVKSLCQVASEGKKFFVGAAEIQIHHQHSDCHARSPQSKAFFSEEKKQKTFIWLSLFYPATTRQDASVLWFFFFRKELLLFCSDIHIVNRLGNYSAHQGSVGNSLPRKALPMIPIMSFCILPFVVAAIAFVLLIANTVKILREYKRAVVFTLGRCYLAARLDERKKAVLFNKRTKKHLCLGVRRRIETRQRRKSLLLLFFRKEGLSHYWPPA